MARKLIGPADVPSIPRYSSEIALGRLFSAADIPTIAAAAPWPLSKEQSAEILAHRLHDSFEQAVEWDRLSELTPARAELRDFHAGIADKAQQLLRALGKDVGCHDDPLDRLAPGIRHLLSATYSLQQPHLSGILHRVLPEFVKGDPLFEARLRANEMLSPTTAPTADPHELKEYHSKWSSELSAWEGLDTAQAIIAALPAMLSLLYVVAEAGRKEMERHDTRRGNNHDVFSANLFGYLAGVHIAMFSKPPRTRDNISDRTGGSLPWLTLVLNLANERILACLRPNDNSQPSYAHPVAAAICRVARLSEATKADRFEKGLALWKRRAERPVENPSKGAK